MEVDWQFFTVGISVSPEICTTILQVVQNKPCQSPNLLMDLAHLLICTYSLNAIVLLYHLFFLSLIR